MKLGFVSAIVPDLNLEEVLDLVASQGLDCVELMSWPKGKATRRYAGVTHVNASEFGKSDAARVRELAASRGVEISALGYYPNALVPDVAEAKVYIAHLKKVIRAAELLGLDRVNSFIGRDWTRSVDDNWRRFR